MFNIILKQLREAHSLTQDDVAKYLNIARATYANYETGNREPSFSTLQKLAGYFGVTTDYLLGNDRLLKLEERPAVYLDDEELDPEDIILIKNLYESLKKKHKK